MSKYCVVYKNIPGHYEGNVWFNGSCIEQLWETKDVDVKAHEDKGYTVKQIHWTVAHKMVRNHIVHNTGLWFDGERIRYATGE